VVELERTVARLEHEAAGKAARLEELHKCSICFELLFDAITAPCGHSHCFSCLHQAAASKAECPTCRCPLQADSSKWLVNAGIQELLEQLGGPAWQASAPTHRLHAAFRTDTTGKGVLALLEQTEAVFDLQRPLRLKGVPTPILHAAVLSCGPESLDAWKGVITQLIGRGFDSDQRWRGFTPLDHSPQPWVVELLVDLGAKVCHPSLLEKMTRWRTPGASSKSSFLGGIVAKVLRLLPDLPRHSSIVRNAMRNCLRNGHNEASLLLLKRGVPVPSRESLDGMPAL
jgi:hypothetical protein